MNGRNNGQWVSLFKHLVGAGRQCGRHFETQHLCGAQIDDEFELGWLHDRQVGGALALENPRSIEADLAISVGKACPITHEAAGRDVLAQFIDRRNGIMLCKRDELLAPAVEKRVAANQQSLHSHLDKSLEGGVNVLRLAPARCEFAGRAREPPLRYPLTASRKVRCSGSAAPRSERPLEPAPAGGRDAFPPSG